MATTRDRRHALRKLLVEGAQQHGDVLAYFLSLNKFPTGSEELRAEIEVLEDIEMDAPKR